jgi:steroid 5-alpha reductase family enzyme
MDISVFVTYLGITVAVFIYITLWFLMAMYVKRIDIIDIAWGLGFIYIAVLALLITQQFDTVQLLATLFVAIWGLRLFLHIGTRLVKGKEDRRYTEFRKKWGDSFWQKTYTNIFLVQGLCMLLISSVSIAIITSETEASAVLAVIGFAIWGFGIIFEAFADYQLRKFVAKNKGKVMSEGLWKYSRHPNYFGEITTWLGAGIVAVSVGAWWGLLGFVIITFLTTKISGIPPIERQRANDPAYQEYKKHTSVLIPLPPK